MVAGYGARRTMTSRSECDAWENAGEKQAVGSDVRTRCHWPSSAELFAQLTGADPDVTLLDRRRKRGANIRFWAGEWGFGVAGEISGKSDGKNATRRKQFYTRQWLASAVDDRVRIRARLSGSVGF